MSARLNAAIRHGGYKIQILLLLTVMLAIHARLRLIPNLNAQNLPVLAGHVIGVTVLAVLFVLVGVGFRTGGLL